MGAKRKRPASDLLLTEAAAAAEAHRAANAELTCAITRARVGGWTRGDIAEATGLALGTIDRRTRKATR